jgi:polysaccharide export outer membrane protein
VRLITHIALTILIIVYYIWIRSLYSQIVSPEDIEIINSLRNQNISPSIDSLEITEGAAESDNQEFISPTLDPDSTVRLFGSEYFDVGAETLNINRIRNIPSNYEIGPGDEITIQILDQYQTMQTLSVQIDGHIAIPRYGLVFVLGIKASDINNAINEWISTRGFAFEVNAFVSSSRPIEIFITGEVNNPGSILVNAYDRLFNAITKAQGITQIASLRNIIIIRDGSVHSYDAYDFLINANPLSNPIIYQGDTIIVPPANYLVETRGRFRRNAIYELREGESVTDLINFTGGMFANANINRGVILREDYQYSEAIPFEFNSSLLDGDILVLPETANEFQESVSVFGDHPMAGVLAWQAGMTIGDIVGMNPPDNIDLSFIAIERTNDEHEFIVLNLQVEDNLAFTLQELDKIFIATAASERILEEELDVENGQDFSIEAQVEFNFESFSREELRRFMISRTLSEQSLSIRFGGLLAEKLVSISGDIRHDGRYPYFNGLTLSNLIDMSGGIINGGDVFSIQVQRFNREPYIINLEEQYDFEIAPGDRVFINRSREAYSSGFITIGGEVMQPGSYLLMEGDTVQDIIQRAGGLTPFSDQEVVFVSRASLIDRELQAREETIRYLTTSLLSASQSNSGQEPDNNTILLAQLLSLYEGTQPLGRIQAQDLKSLPLQRDDAIIIPLYSNTVSIIGEVMIPSNLFLNGELSLEEAIERSGDITEFASNQVLVIDKYGLTELFEINSRAYRRKMLNPGDTVSVLPDVRNEFIENLNIFSSVSQVIYQLAVTTASLRFLGQ